MMKRCSKKKNIKILKNIGLLNKIEWTKYISEMHFQFFVNSSPNDYEKINKDNIYLLRWPI